MQLSKELRIGNWILKNMGEHYETIQVDSTDLTFIKRAELEDGLENYYRPIEINESALLQGGFKKVIEECYSITMDGYTMAVYYNEKDGIYRLNNRFNLGEKAHKHYVHQLQNLIYTIAGCELKLDTAPTPG